jgi:hypothetical protein
MESAELDGDTSSNAYERGEGAFVKSKRAFGGIDCTCGSKGGGIGCGSLKPDFDYIERLTWGYVRLLISAL